MSLKEYRRKRKFNETPEPSPGKKRSPGKGKLTFVVQKHAASRTHYDFRLEFGGSLKSWAVPKGPTLTSQDPRLAVHVEDHPLEYGKFEGTIPAGNYGAGTVMIWDRGTYVERNSKGRKDSEKALQEGFEKGHLTFLLSGEKLRGEFALIKIKKKGAPPNSWLLVKKHDAEASRFDILKEDRSVVTGRTMDEIRVQAPKAGDVWLPKKGRTATEPKKSELPQRVRVMEPAFSTQAPTGGEWIFEGFGAGIRAVSEVKKGQARLSSRSSLPLEKKFPGIVEGLKKLKSEGTFDGEIIRDGGKTFFQISDVLFFHGKDLREKPLRERKKILSKLTLTDPLRVSLGSSAVDQVPGKALTLVAKKLDSLYVGGISKEWLRFRPRIQRGIAPTEKPPLTHPDKIYWPEKGYTKGDLVRYYEGIADVIVPHLIDKPQSLHRQPDGIRNEGFFHKDMASYLPKRIKTFRVFSESARKTVNYVLCQDKWSLLYLVNLGCIELNPWLSRIQDLDKPDYLVIDLDPDGNSFNEVVRVAQGVHRVLEAVGAKSFCKTSGASGLHICVPTAGKYDYETVREFAEKVCEAVHREFPKITSVERNPAKRKGRIYLDFLQNRRAQTLAAPYCVRPRPEATVSAPLRWSEVKPGLRPEKFTIKTIGKRLAQVGDLWKPMLTTHVDIPACLKKLSKIFHN